MKMMSNKKGFTLIELAIGIAIIAVLILAISAGAGMRENANVQSAAQSVNTLRTAAENYIASGNLTYTGVDVATLKTMSLLPSNFSGTASNPWGGDYTVGANTNPSKIDVSLTSVNAPASTRLNALFANSASSTNYSGTTWTVTF